MTPTPLYITAQDVKDFSALPKIQAMDDKYILQKIEMAQYRIESYCNQSFVSSEEAITVSGTDTNLVTLNKRIYQLDSLFVDDQECASYAIIDNDGYGLKLKDSFILFNPIPNKYNEYQKPKFPKGTANIVITGRFGWADIPNDVLFCIKKLAEAYCLFLGDEQYLTAESGIYKKQSIEGYSYELKDPSQLTATESTGDATVDIYLKKYKRTLKRNSVKVGVV